ncbi:hypothetical protein PVAG01_08165 [Phlyctema vagabunda]|uniref:HORMA domain-containing protein n=1 Tax=Phlyctema vagabunda TaxID=108571 RepID=A0ABR4P8U0_9HELO
MARSSKAKNRKQIPKKYGKRTAKSTQVVKPSQLQQPGATSPPSPKAPEAPKPRTSKHDSFELMKILVTATISAVALHRGIISTEYSKTLPFDTYNPDASAQLFFNGIANDGHPKNPNGPTDILLVTRGSHPHCDKLYGWIDGINDAMERQFLKEFKLVLGTGPHERLDLLESYTFHFTYSYGGPSLQIDTQRASGEVDTSKFLFVTKEDIKSFIGDLREWLLPLDELPVKPSVRMELKYTDSAPEDFHAINFKAYGFVKPSLDTSAQTKKSLASVNTGHHSVVLDCVTTVTISEDEFEEFSAEKRSELPSQDSNPGSTPHETGERLQQSIFNRMAISRGEGSAPGDTQDTVLLPIDSQNLDGPHSFGKHHTAGISKQAGFNDTQINVRHEEATSQATKPKDATMPRHCECGVLQDGDTVVSLSKFRAFLLLIEPDVVKILYYMRTKRSLHGSKLQALCDCTGGNSLEVSTLLDKLVKEEYLSKIAGESSNICVYTYASTDERLRGSRYFPFQESQVANNLSASFQSLAMKLPEIQSLGSSTTASVECSPARDLYSTPRNGNYLWQGPIIGSGGFRAGPGGKKRTSESPSDESRRKRARATPLRISASTFESPLVPTTM